MAESEEGLAIKIEKVCEVLSEIAELHLKLGKHSTEDMLTTVITWRYGIEGWVARDLAKRALVLLDAMPKKY